MRLVWSSAFLELRRRASFGVMKVRILATRSGWLLFGLGVLGAPPSSAYDPFGPRETAAATRAAGEVLLRTQWVEPPESSLFVPGGGWSIHALEKAKALLETLRSERKGELGRESTLRAGPEEPAVLTFTPGNADPEAPPAKVIITVGNVPQEFTATNVGVEAQLYRESGDGGGAGSRLRAVVKRTRFLGFEALTSDGAGGAARPKFYRPIFETDTRESVFAIGAGECAILRVDWPPQIAQGWLERVPKGPGSKEAWRPAKDRSALLLVMRAAD